MHGEKLKVITERRGERSDLNYRAIKEYSGFIDGKNRENISFHSIGAFYLEVSCFATLVLENWALKIK